MVKSIQLNLIPEGQGERRREDDEVGFSVLPQ